MADHPLPGRYRVEARNRIDAPADKVWDVLADFSAVDTWAPQVERSYALGPADTGVGAGRHCDIKGFGGIDEIVTDWQEGRTLTYEVTPLGPFGKSYNRWTVRPVGAGACEVKVELAYSLRYGIAGRLMHALVMAPKLRKAMPQSLEALRQRVETGRTVRNRRAAPGQPQRLAAA